MRSTKVWPSFLAIRRGNLSFNASLPSNTFIPDSLVKCKHDFKHSLRYLDHLQKRVQCSNWRFHGTQLRSLHRSPFHSSHPTLRSTSSLPTDISHNHGATYT